MGGFLGPRRNFYAQNMMDMSNTMSLRKEPQYLLDGRLGRPQKVSVLAPY
jgi:hypothetical protein